MFDRLAAELEAHMRWLTPPWIHDRDPPGEGFYLVTVSVDIFDDGKLSRSVRLERWDGKTWATLGGYAQPEAWYFLPTPWSGEVREESVRL